MSGCSGTMVHVAQLLWLSLLQPEGTASGCPWQRLGQRLSDTLQLRLQHGPRRQPRSPVTTIVGYFQCTWLCAHATVTHTASAFELLPGARASGQLRYVLRLSGQVVLNRSAGTTFNNAEVQFTVPLFCFALQFTGTVPDSATGIYYCTGGLLRKDACLFLSF